MLANKKNMLNASSADWFFVAQARKGAFTYDVRFVGRQVGQAASDFTT